MSLFRRSAPPARATPPAPVRELTLLIESDAGRVGLFARAEKCLPDGEVLVQVRDLVGERRSFRTVPLHADARLVAREPPVVLRGGLTSLVSYYRVPLERLQAREEHFEGGRFSHAYDVTLRIVGRGGVQAALPA